MDFSKPIKPDKNSAIHQYSVESGHNLRLYPKTAHLKIARPETAQLKTAQLQNSTS